MTTGIDDAVDLMQRAVAHLEAGGATDAANRLRDAIGDVRMTPPIQFERELDAARAALDAESQHRQIRPPSDRLH